VLSWIIHYFQSAFITLDVTGRKFQLYLRLEDADGSSCKPAVQYPVSVGIPTSRRISTQLLSLTNVTVQVFKTYCTVATSSFRFYYTNDAYITIYQWGIAYEFYSVGALLEFQLRKFVNFPLCCQGRSAQRNINPFGTHKCWPSLTCLRSIMFVRICYMIGGSSEVQCRSKVVKCTF
jgi:hypothetical protein